MGDAEQDFIDQLDQGDEPDDDGQLSEGIEEVPVRQQLTMFDRWLELQQQGHIDPQMSKGVLKQMRHAIGKALTPAKQLERQAFEAGKREARAEFVENPEQLREQFRAEIRQELLGETQRERSLGRLGVPPPLQGLFADVPADDHRAFEKRADQLRSQGVSWGDSDPLVREISRQRVAAWQQQASQQNGNGVPLDPAAGVPAAVQEQVIRQQVEDMVQAASGAQPVGADSLEDEIRRADPERLGQAGVEDLARRFNAQLDAISHQARGGW